ncbi:MAG: acetyl-CoA C-acyltransferase [Alphaproteobacteria bacterium]|nr:acetyl-CoA C-acyltransferase [Alphaproteobacteria bacterium]
MNEVVIVGAARTPLGVLSGALSSLSAAALGTHAIMAALACARLAPEDVEEVVLGQVLTAAAGMNPARQAARAAGIPVTRTAYLVNQVCGSGLRAVAAGYQAIRLGEASIVVAGGQESMSQAPHATLLRGGLRQGDALLRDTMLGDGLTCALLGIPMGATAENIARTRGLSRGEQDRFALASQAKAEAAHRAGRFIEEIAPLTWPSRTRSVTIAEDERPHARASAETLARLKPVFAIDGTVTAGNASGINDGAAALVLASAAEAKRRGLIPLARIASWATAGVEPEMMGLGPVPAIQQALARAGWSAAELDLIELNEAFAVQALAVINDLALDSARVNVNGGAIALGHPIGASGARILVTLLYEMRRRQARKGLAALCIGGGMGIALCVEALGMDAA